MENQNINELFLCPITFQIMTDPVLCADLQTYERSAIEEWLQTNDTSPMTNQKLLHFHLTPNLVLRQLIQQSNPQQKNLQQSSKNNQIYNNDYQKKQEEIQKQKDLDVQLKEQAKSYPYQNQSAAQINSKFIFKEISLKDPIPQGWHLATKQEVINNKNAIIKTLSQWAIVAFDGGKIDGSSYGNKINDSYGNECGRKLIAKYE